LPYGKFFVFLCQVNTEALHILRQVYPSQFINNELFNTLTQKHDLLQYKKGDKLLKTGQVLQGYYIIINGLARSVITSFENKEITTDFFTIGNIMINVSSVFQQQPSQVQFEAITDLTCFKIDYLKFQELFTTEPRFAEWGRNWMTLALFESNNRYLNSITQPAVQRYTELHNQKPLVTQLAPLKYIASYLGITDTSLSRIRKELTQVTVL
jgi:CRP/FNR family transcriptional regulator, anaerobic regulatory protein